MDEGLPAIKAVLMKRRHPLTILFLALAARRSRMRHLPPEPWMLIRDEFLALSPTKARAVTMNDGTDDSRDSNGD